MKPKLIPCKTCGHRIAAKASRCPQCGQSFNSLPRIIILILLTILLAWIARFLFIWTYGPAF